MMNDGGDMRGGGVLIALALVAGGAIGVALQQGPLGVLIGLGVGVLAALGLAWHDRRPR